MANISPACLPKGFFDNLSAPQSAAQRDVLPFENLYSPEANRASHLRAQAKELFDLLYPPDSSNLPVPSNSEEVLSIPKVSKQAVEKARKAASEVSIFERLSQLDTSELDAFRKHFSEVKHGCELSQALRESLPAELAQLAIVLAYRDKTPIVAEALKETVCSAHCKSSADSITLFLSLLSQPATKDLLNTAVQSSRTPVLDQENKKALAQTLFGRPALLAAELSAAENITQAQSCLAKLTETERAAVMNLFCAVNDRSLLNYPFPERIKYVASLAAADSMTEAQACLNSLCKEEQDSVQQLFFERNEVQLTDFPFPERERNLDKIAAAGSVLEAEQLLTQLSDSERAAVRKLFSSRFGEIADYPFPTLLPKHSFMRKMLLSFQDIDHDQDGKLATEELQSYFYKHRGAALSAAASVLLHLFPKGVERSLLIDLNILLTRKEQGEVELPELSNRLVEKIHNLIDEHVTLLQQRNCLITSVQEFQKLDSLLRRYIDSDRNGSFSREEVLAAVVNPIFKGAAAQYVDILARYQTQLANLEDDETFREKEVSSKDVAAIAAKPELFAGITKSLEQSRSRLKNRAEGLFGEDLAKAAEAVEQGYLNNSAFLSAAILLAQTRPEQFKQMFSDDGNGRYKVHLPGVSRQHKSWHEESPEMGIPTDSELLLYTSATKESGLCFALLEKALGYYLYHFQESKKLASFAEYTKNGFAVEYSSAVIAALTNSSVLQSSARFGRIPLGSLGGPFNSKVKERLEEALLGPEKKLVIARTGYGKDAEFYSVFGYDALFGKVWIRDPRQQGAIRLMSLKEFYETFDDAFFEER